MNDRLPLEGVFPMHCSANVGDDGDVAVFFGLSGTGKTTLSADPARRLIGDDEHGWGVNGVFNIEGGCYAKVIRLSAEAEPDIYRTTRTYGTILENVVVDERGVVDLDDGSKTENTRAAYTLEQIPNALPAKMAGHPRNVVFLTADAFGILPPIARLSRAQALYWFLSGFTAKLAGTEIGVTEPQPTFSTCFGAPFLPQRPSVYARMLGEKLDAHGSSVWLVNTGWTGGPFGEGHRMPIAATRALLNAALTGALDGVEYRVDPVFGFEVPVAVPGVDTSLLDPRSTWADPEAYDDKARYLAERFRANFEEKHADDAGPEARGRRAEPGSSVVSRQRRPAAALSLAQELRRSRTARPRRLAEARAAIGASSMTRHVRPARSDSVTDRCTTCSSSVPAAPACAPRSRPTTRGASVAVVSKLHPTRSHSGAAEGGINAALGNTAEDDPGEARLRHRQGLRLPRRPGRDRDPLPRGARRHLPARALGRRLLAQRGRAPRAAAVRRRGLAAHGRTRPTSPATSSSRSSTSRC